MSLHPAWTMLAVWLGCSAYFFLLPFEVFRPVSGEGVALLGLFILAFVVGSGVVPTGKPGRLPSATQWVALDASLARYCLGGLSLLASVSFMLDVATKNVFDLVAAAAMRNDAATALLQATASESSPWFQIAFLLYPAGFVVLAIELVLQERPRLTVVVALGLVPGFMAALSMGGRMPILYAVLIMLLSARERHRLGRPPILRWGRKMPAVVLWGKWVVLPTMMLILLIYFAQVFAARANSSGGAVGMFAFASENWGVGFSGWMNDLMVDTLGIDVTYLVFVFSWYLVQGLVISNTLFSSFDGPIQWGAYGVDLVSAAMRRLNPEGLAQGFDALLAINVYGFFPTAWGSLYVDLGLSALLVALAWGVGAALVYRRAVIQGKARWSLLWPFVVAGILTSLINTPIGFSNGLMTHLWLFVAFGLLRSRQRETSGEDPA